MKKIVYVDMDKVLVHFQSGIDKLTEAQKEEYEGRLDQCPGVYGLMDPKVGAIEGFKTLAVHYDTYILSTSPWLNPSSWTDKLEWVQRYFGKAEGTPAYKRLILTHHKNLNRGDYLIDDGNTHGAAQFEGELIHFGGERFPDWDSVIEYLVK